MSLINGTRVDRAAASDSGIEAETPASATTDGHDFMGGLTLSRALLSAPMQMRMHTNTQEQQAQGRKWVRPTRSVSPPVQSMRGVEAVGAVGAVGAPSGSH